MTAVSPFRALRYDERVAGPLPTLVAPPYDVIGDDDVRRLREASAYNIVHLTRPGSPGEAAHALGAWRQSGVLREEASPSLWWISQEYVGPDGVRRTREGIAGSVEASPYSEGRVLPHERTHAEVKEERLAILRATRTQLEPIFLLYDADVPVEPPAGDPELEIDVGGVVERVWRLESDGIDLDVPLLIADGHHRYETAVAYRAEEPAAARTFAVLVSSRSPGLEIFPTHRTARAVGVEPAGPSAATRDPGALEAYRDGAYVRLDAGDELDTRAVERYAPEGVAYTPDASEAVLAVDRGEAELAFLVRPPTVSTVFEVALRGETMPQKTTFFYPKLTSGLLLHPV